MAALVCRHLRIRFVFVAKARMRPPHDLKIHPAQADLEQKLDVARTIDSGVIQ